MQWGLLTSSRGLTALLGDVDVPTSRPGDTSAGRARDMAPGVVLSIYQGLLFGRVIVSSLLLAHCRQEDLLWIDTSEKSMRLRRLQRTVPSVSTWGMLESDSTGGRDCHSFSYDTLTRARYPHRVLQDGPAWSTRWISWTRGEVSRRV